MNRYGNEKIPNEVVKESHGERLPKPLDLRRVGDKFQPLTPFSYHDTKSERTITARPRGCDGNDWYSDLASIPALLRIFASVVQWAEAAVIHDWACDWLRWDNGVEMTQGTADRLFKDIAIYTGHSRWKVYPAYWLIVAHSKTVKRWRDK